MLRLMLLIVLPEAICVTVLVVKILTGQLNKMFSLIPQIINSLHRIYCMVFNKIFLV